MLRGTRKRTSLLASISNCAGVMALCFLLLATTVVISPQNLHSPLLRSASAQQAEEEEQGTTDSGAEEEQGSTDSGAEEEQGTTDSGAEEEQGTTDSGAEEEQGTTDSGARADAVSQPEALTTLQRVVDLAGITDPRGLEEIAGASDSDEVAEIAGASDSEALAETPGITSPEAVDAIASVSDLRGLAQLVGLSIDDLFKQVLPEQPPATEPLTAEISSDYTATDEHVAPATISFAANASGGTGPYTVSWNFGDDSEESDEQSVAHTFNEAGNYTVALTATDSTGETATDTLEIAVAESSEEPAPPAEGGTDKWGIKEIYPTASIGPTWFIREVKDPTTDPLFYYGIYEGTTVISIGTGVWRVNAESGTQEHGIRMHVDSPTGKWKNTEMTAYFNIHTGE